MRHRRESPVGAGSHIGNPVSGVGFLALTLLALPNAWADDVPKAEQIQFFEASIRPILVNHCYACHSADGAKGIKGGLAVDTRAGLLLGGDGGPAVVPGDLDASRLIAAVRHGDEDLQMPPKGKLPAAAIADLERWVTMGAPDPRDGEAVASPRKTINIEEGRQFWSFQPPRQVEPPPVRDASWPRSAIDRFVLAGMEAQGLHPVADADRRTLIRRATFDLIGLPPSPEEVAAFLADPDPTPEAFARVVDRLLADPGYGERWGRHWLDVARFAESSGKEQNILYPHAWRYRDYVIQAFRADKPYNIFLKEQLAGDLLPARDAAERADHQIATGYLALGPKSHNTREVRQFRLDLADEQIDATTQGMLGLTVACARCHDHKTDPIRQQDYYALAGIFLSTDTLYGTARGVQNRNPAELAELPEAAGVPRGERMKPAALRALRDQYDAARKERDALVAESRAKRDRSILMGNAGFLQLNNAVNLLETTLAAYEDDGTPKPLAMAVRERPRPVDAPVLARGEVDRPGEIVPRGFPAVLMAADTSTDFRGSGRLKMAEWIASPSNPLTARVLANRVWHHLFGRGIVASVDNFGATGALPTHPELLDTLAVQFVTDGWSVKRLIRSIMTSHAYQLSAAHSEANAAIDPDNLQYWRMTPRRLEAEAIRDAVLAASGRLDRTPPVGSAVMTTGDGPVARIRLTPSGGALALPIPLRGQRPPMGPGTGSLRLPDPLVRSVYLPSVRDRPVEVLAAFDPAESSLVMGAREATTVPSQALLMLNSPFAMREAVAMADRIGSRSEPLEQRVASAFAFALARPPRPDEVDAARRFFQEFPQRAVKPRGEGRTPPTDLMPGRGPGGGGQAGQNPRLQAMLAATLVDVPGLDNADPDHTAWAVFCQSLFASAEFRIVE